LLLLCQRELEMYHEYLQRMAASEWTEQRAYEVMLAVTGDSDAAEQAANATKFASTPLGNEE
jgi:hypothetical protein